MDDLNQLQNPNMAPMMPPISGGSAQASAGKKSYLLWVILAVAVAVAAVAWWYVGQMAVEMPVIQNPQINQEAREDMMISNDIQGAGSADLDQEFQEVDKDINSL